MALKKKNNLQTKKENVLRDINYIRKELKFHEKSLDNKILYRTQSQYTIQYLQMLCIQYSSLLHSFSMGSSLIYILT